LRLIAIIPARGGSKRIPKKNIKEFNQRPMLSFAIEAVKKSKIFSEIIVSTDSSEVKAVSESLGVSVPFYRSKKNSSDFATTADVISEVLEQLNCDSDDIFCCIYPCVPLLQYKTLTKAFDCMIKSDGDFLIPVTEFTYPIQRCLSIQEGRLFFDKKEFFNSRSQDLEKKYHDVGQFFFGKVGVFNKEKTMFNEKTVPFVINPLYVQDIDNISDWKIAEFKYRYLSENNLI
jgi:pseudaminic acid cytidylyltransferase